MRLILVGILGILLSFSGLRAQDYSLRLTSGSLKSEENLNDFITGDTPQASELVDGRYYRLIQFYQTPGPAQQQAIEASGIQLLDYVPNYTFVASLPANFDRSLLGNFGVRAVYKLAAQHKLRQSLTELPLPDHAVNAPGRVDVVVIPFRGIPLPRTMELLADHPVEFLAEARPGMAQVRIRPEYLPTLAEAPFVSFIEPIDPPALLENYTARSLVRSNVINSDHGLARHYDGSGVIAAMGDNGIIGPHIDYTGRVDNRAVDNTGNHGDHVAGTIMGAGNLNPLHRGMAPGVTLQVYDVWDAVNSGGIANQQDGVILTSTSYSNGCNAGYTNFAQTADQMVRMYPELIHVFSAGNSGTSDCGYGAGNLWGNVTGGVKIGKNVIAVANLDINSNVVGSSSRGPAHDGRIKPEISAKGTNVVSTIDENDYEPKTGTSMSCPGVSGVLSQLNQAYRELNGGQVPPSGLMKAILLNSADDIDNPGPDFKTGFGKMNALRAVEALENQTYDMDSIQQSGIDNFTINVPSGTAQLKVMVYWHDYEATVLSSVALVNNLDIAISDPNSTVYQPWVLDHSPSPSALNSPATRGTDALNNMEQITIDAPTPGNHTLTINGTNIPFGPVGYYIAYEFRDSSARMTYPNGGESFVAGETELVQWDAEGDYGAWTLEYTTNGGSTWLMEISGLAGDVRQHYWTVPNGMQTGELRFRVSRSGISDESDYDASIMRVPTNLDVVSGCPTYCMLEWDSIPTASEYDIFMLGNKYMDSIGTTTNAFFQVTGINSTDENWFAVRARGANGEIGRRTIAVMKPVGVFNCQEPNDPKVAEVTAPGEGALLSCTMDLTQVPIKVLLENMSPNALTNIPVSYRLDNGAVVTENFTGTLPGHDTASYTFTTPLDMSATGNHVLESWVTFPSDMHNDNDSTSILVEVLASNSYPLPFEENFDTWNICPSTSNCELTQCALGPDWNQSSNGFIDDIDWRSDIGGTPTPGTGPSSDHTTGQAFGRYLYTEASLCFEQRADLMTPCIDLGVATAPEFNFWFHRLGTDQGPLHIDLFADGQWNLDVTSPKISNWYGNWWEDVVDLSQWQGQTVVARFRGTTGEDFLSDMALDDIGFKDNPVSISDPLTGNSLQVYPNPSSGAFKFVLRGLNADRVSLKVFDLNGRMVREQALGSVQGDYLGQLDLAGQGAGMYFLQIDTGVGMLGAKVIVE